MNVKEKRKMIHIGNICLLISNELHKYVITDLGLLVTKRITLCSFSLLSVFVLFFLSNHIS